MNGELPSRLESLVERYELGERSSALALHALISTASTDGAVAFDNAATRYRDDYLAVYRSEGRDAEREAGRLSLDEVRKHLRESVLPRLANDHVIKLPSKLDAPDAEICFKSDLWSEISAHRETVARRLLGRTTGEFATQTPPTGVVAIAPAKPIPAPPVAAATPSAAPAPAERPVEAVSTSVEGNGKQLSTLEAKGLFKIYRRRKVVNDVALHLRQGEIVGLLGPNGAGKTTTFYMIVGMIEPQSGQILLDGEDITKMPMFRRARRGLGYLSQEPSIFRKLSVEDNVLAILETLPLTNAEREQRLETLLGELKITHLRKSKAYALSGGERRRLEITRALVTQPKFMMLDEPFAGVDPIAVNDIQGIVAGLRHRGIGVLISDHNVEQTLDIVDRAYIMFEGQVKVSGTVRELVFDDTVAEIYLGPTLTARLRARFSASPDGDAAP
jgi:lipopolysaccharide export system ATP-binding protein